MKLNSFLFGMSLTVFAAAFVVIVGGCSSNGNTKSPDFWGAKAAPVYATMSTDQQSQAAQVSADLSRIMLFAQNSGSDATDLNAYSATITPPTTGDSVTSGAIATNCVHRSQEIKDPTEQSSTYTVREWYDDSDKTSCPVTLELSGSSTAGGGAAGSELHTPSGHGGVNVGTEARATLDYSLNFVALPGTTVYDQGSIRSFTLLHHEESYQLTRNAAIATMEGKVNLSKSVSGTIVLASGAKVPFTMLHSSDYRVLPIDQTTTANAGRDLQEIDLVMPFGHASVRVDSVFNGKMKGSTTTTYVNGAVVSQKTL